MAQFVNGFMQDADMKNLARDASTSAPAEKKTVAGPVKNRDRPSGSTLAMSVQYTQTQVIDVSEQVLRENKLAALFEDSPAAEQYKILRTQIFHKIKGQELNTIMVTSPGCGEGKSLTAANLAISLAKDAVHTAMLVDADFYTPAVQKIFGLSLDKGLAHCLVRGIPISDILVNPGINRLTLLPGSPDMLPEVSEAAGAPEMKALINEIKNRYDDRLIVFDAPPVLEKADALILSQLVGGVILVVEQGRTQKKQVTKALGLLKNANLLGVVLNNKADN